MAEKKKDKSKKHQPRDADNTFGQNVQKSGLSTKRRSRTLLDTVKILPQSRRI